MNLKGIYTDSNTQIVLIDTPGVHKPLNELGKYLSNQAKDALVDTFQEVVFFDESADIFETNKVIVNNFGGISAGTDLNGLTVHEILKQMLYPYVAPVVSVACTPDGGIYEKVIFADSRALFACRHFDFC